MLPSEQHLSFHTHCLKSRLFLIQVFCPLNQTPLCRYCTELVLPWLSAHNSSAFPRAQLHLCLLQGLVLGVTTHVPPPLLPPSSSPREVPRQVRRDSRAKFLTLDGKRELGSQGTEKKKQQQSKAAASSLASPVPTQV